MEMNKILFKLGLDFKVTYLDFEFSMAKSFWREMHRNYEVLLFPPI